MPGAFAVVGAAAFVAVSMKMPMTAVALILEFTRVGPDFIVPVLFAVAGSVSVGELCALRERKKNELFSAETLSAGPAPAPDFLEQRGR
jgi:H+/Cl- antiporter ClcA